MLTLRLFSVIILVMLVLSQSNTCLSQSDPRDTVYYSNKKIKSILFGRDRILTGHTCKVIYSTVPESTSILGERLMDSVLAPFPHLVTKRSYYPESTILIRDIVPDKGANERLSSLDVIFNISGTVELSLGFFNDSSLSILAIYVVDSLTWENIERLVYLPFGRGSHIAKNNRIDLGIHGSISMRFYEAGLLNYLNYTAVNLEKDTIELQLYFDKKQNVSIFKTHNVNLNRTEILGFYDQGPFIKYEKKYMVVGVGELLDNQGNFFTMDGKKRDGIWQYYSTKGGLVKEETYKGGELVATKEY